MIKLKSALFIEGVRLPDNHTAHSVSAADARCTLLYDPTTLLVAIVQGEKLRCSPLSNVKELELDDAAAAKFIAAAGANEKAKPGPKAA